LLEKSDSDSISIFSSTDIEVSSNLASPATSVVAGNGAEENAGSGTDCIQSNSQYERNKIIVDNIFYP
jgi:hypothetical protein